MKSGKFENGMAWAGVLIVLFAVSSAFTTALADDATLLDNSLKFEVSTSD